jgi:hypothetical protein
MMWSASECQVDLNGDPPAARAKALLAEDLSIALRDSRCVLRPDKPRRTIGSDRPASPARLVRADEVRGAHA